MIKPRSYLPGHALCRDHRVILRIPLADVGKHVVCDVANIALGGGGAPSALGGLFFVPQRPRGTKRPVPNCGTCGTVISALSGEAVMTRILHETLLLSCMAAFAIGVVLAAASVIG